LRRTGPRRIARDYLSSVDSRSYAKSDLRLTFEIGVQASNRVPQILSGPYRPHRVVLMRGWNPEHGDDSVTDELLDCAPMTLERSAGLLEVALHDSPQRLWVKPLAQRRRTGDIGEYNGDRLSGLRHEPSLRLARRKAERVSLRWPRAVSPLRIR
jgi:hypothetical protein